MARQQILCSIPQNHNRTMPQQSIQNSKKSVGRARMRSASLSSLSSTSSQASSSRGRQSQNIMSPSVSPDENKAKRERFVEMFSPVRAIRAARAGMKRKRGGGPLVLASTRGSAFRKGGMQTKATTSEDPSNSVDLKRTIRRSRRTESRDASNASLHRGMRAMVLTDNEPDMVVLRPGGSSRKASGSGSVRSTRSRLHRQGREESEDEVIDDVEEDERLLLQAPSWQLHRLKKTKLFKLHVMLGTWQEGEVVDLDLYNKQELVEGLIKARSCKIVSRKSALLEESPGRVDQMSPSPLSNSHSKKTSVSRKRLSHSSAYTDEEETASETEANDAGGEETEAEPMKSSKRRQDVRMSRLYSGQGVSSPMVTRLRRARPKGSYTGNEVHFAREGAMKGGMSSGVSTPLGRRLRPSRSSLFAASSPARTRLRTKNQSSSSLLRLALPGNRASAARDVFPSNQTLPQQRRKRGSVDHGSNLYQEVREERDNDSDDALDWEDASPTSVRGYSLKPPRKAKLKAKEQLHHQLQGQDHIIEEAEVDMSMDETPTKTNIKKQMSTSAQTMENDSDHEFSSEKDPQDLVWEEDGAPSETDINASPSKMRKLRNGKIRLLTGDVAGKHREIEEDIDEKGDEEQDIEMDEAESVVDVADAAMDHPTASSLNRLRRSQLIHLCDRYDVVVAGDATKAFLIEALLSVHSIQTAPDSSRTQRAESSASSRTAGLDSGSSAQTQTSRARRNRTSGQQTRRSQRLSEKPLLLRSHSNEVQRSKPPSPVPSNVALSPAAGEEELNGLDLESLNLVDKEIQFSKLEKLEKIGSGGFKDVYIGKYQISKKSTKRVAIADIRDQLSEMDIKELTLLRDLKHENIVRFIGVCVPPLDMRMVPCMIVSELCSNGDLFDYIRNVAPPPDEEIFRIMLETARGLEYLHTRTPAIIHRDVKSTNVLVTRNKTAKINDFGLARVRNTQRSMIKSLVGTVNWQAAELWSPKPNYNEKVDVWSAAMTFWETLQWHQPEKKYPFQEMNEHQIYLDVGHKKLRPSTVSIRRTYGGEIVDLLDEMWDHTPKERPTMTQVCQRLEALIEMKKQSSRAKLAQTRPTR